MSGVVTLAVIHWIHVGFSVFWMGTVLHSRMVVFPGLRKLPSEYEPAVRRSTFDRRRTLTAAWGAVGFGILRGVLGGALSEPGSVYGLTFLASLVIGAAMAAWLSGPWPKRGVGDRLYVAGFPVIFTLMVAMRFGY